MKKFLLAFALLPLVSFGAFDFDESIRVSAVRLYTWTDFDVSPNRLSVPSYNVNSLEQFYSVFSSGSWGFKINLRRTTTTGYNYTFVVPSLLSSSTYTNSANGSIGFCVSASTNSGVGSVSMSSLYFPSVAALYQSAATLFSLGYRGAGVSWFQSSSITSNFCVNVNYPLLVSDVMTSTNTLYRSTLLSYLNSIQSSLSSIGSSVGTINQDYQTVNNLILNPSKQNLLDSAANSPSLNANSTTAFNLDQLYGPSYAGRESEITKALSDLARSQLQAAWLSTLDRDSPFYMQNLDNIISDPDTFQKAALQGGGGGGSALANIMRDVKKLSTNDWVAGVTNQLANNRASITNQLAHMFDDDTSVGSKLGNIEASSSQSASAAGSIDERLARGITVAVVNSGANSVLVSLDGPVNIDQSQFNSLSVPLGSLQNTVSDWYSDWYSFFSVSSPVYKWENFYNMVSAFKDANHTDLVSLQSCVSNLLLSFHGDLTNSLVSTNGYLLLSDYADYIHSGGLDTLLDVMDDDSYSDLKSEIDSLYHVDVAEGYGRWWRYFTGLSTVQANSIFKLSNIFQAHEKLLMDLKRDNSDLYVQDASDPSVFRKLLYTIPTEEDTFNKLAQLTNSIDQSGMVRVQSLIPDLTNRLSVAASLFDKDFSLPTEISWELIPSDPSINSKARIVTIRPYDHYRLFQMLHYGLAFSYCLVNLILFPKFLLLLVRLFDRVWNKSEKLIYNSTQS